MASSASTVGTPSSSSGHPPVNVVGSRSPATSGTDSNARIVAESTSPSAAPDPPSVPKAPPANSSITTSIIGPSGSNPSSPNSGCPSPSPISPRIHGPASSPFPSTPSANANANSTRPNALPVSSHNPFNSPSDPTSSTVSTPPPPRPG